MTLQEAKSQYGATHYSTRSDGETPQLVYKQAFINYNDSTCCLAWFYLSFENIWCRSLLSLDQLSNLKQI